MLEDYRKYLFGIRNNLIQCGVEFPITSCEGYRDLYELSINLDSILWYYSVLEVSGSEDRLIDFFIPLNIHYKSIMRDIFYREFRDYLKEYNKLNVRSYIRNPKYKIKDLEKPKNFEEMYGIQTENLVKLSEIGIPEVSVEYVSHGRYVEECDLHVKGNDNIDLDTLEEESEDTDSEERVLVEDNLDLLEEEESDLAEVPDLLEVLDLLEKDFEKSGSDHIDFIEEEDSDIVEEPDFIEEEGTDIVEESDFIEDVDSDIVEESDFLEEDSDFIEEGDSDIVEESDFLEEESDFIEEESDILDEPDFIEDSDFIEEENLGILEESDFIEEDSDFIEESDFVEEEDTGIIEESDFVEESDFIEEDVDSIRETTQMPEDKSVKDFNQQSQIRDKPDLADQITGFVEGCATALKRAGIKVVRALEK